MSVIQIDPTEFGRIASTLLRSQYADDFSWCVFDTRESMEIHTLLTHLESHETVHQFEEAKNTMIFTWVDRLYLANQIAAAITYVKEREFTLEHLRVTLLDLDPYPTLIEFYEQLRNIRYNIYTNNGRCMFDHDDMIRLDDLIDAVAHQIILDMPKHEE